MLDRTVAPPFKKITKINIRQPEKILLSNGLELYTINTSLQPVLKLDLIFRAGKWFEKNNGISFFTGKMLSEGVPGLSSVQIAAVFEKYGAQLEISPGFDFLSVSVYCLSKHLKYLLQLIKQIISEPLFPEKELNTLKNIEQQTLRVNNEKTSYVAGKKLQESLFGSSHPYGRNLSEADINHISKSEIKHFFDEFIKDKPFTLIASGGFDKDVENLISSHFGTVEFTEWVNFSPIPVNSNQKDVIISNKNRTQTSIQAGKLSIPMRHRDYHGLLIVNEILGGYFGSRLMKNIREEKGLTYGIYSSLVNWKNSSYFVIATDVKKELRTKAVAEIKKEIIRLNESLVSSDELETVKNYLLGQIQASVNTPFALAHIFKNLFINELSYAYYDNLFRTIEEITSEDIRSIANRYLSTTEMVTVSVG
ncbi:MAG: insulinase family protein [Bacteroidetes bacterium]|nr:insulinase family protein [Bacteroidota bacterium]